MSRVFITPLDINMQMQYQGRVKPTMKAEFSIHFWYKDNRTIDTNMDYKRMSSKNFNLPRQNCTQASSPLIQSFYVCVNNQHETHCCTVHTIHVVKFLQ